MELLTPALRFNDARTIYYCVCCSVIRVCVCVGGWVCVWVGGCVCFRVATEIAVTIISNIRLTQSNTFTTCLSLRFDISFTVLIHDNYYMQF